MTDSNAADYGLTRPDIARQVQRTGGPAATPVYTEGASRGAWLMFTFRYENEVKWAEVTRSVSLQ